MSILYADTSALARAYLPDEAGHRDLRRLLREDEVPVVTSEITRVEFARAVRAAARRGRHQKWRLILDRFEHETGPDGTIALIGLRPETVLQLARDIVLEQPVGTLDAIHLAVALGEASELGGELVFVTRDKKQAAAAKALGLRVS